MKLFYYSERVSKIWPLKWPPGCVEHLVISEALLVSETEPDVAGFQNLANLKKYTNEKEKGTGSGKKEIVLGVYVHMKKRAVMSSLCGISTDPLGNPWLGV